MKPKKINFASIQLLTGIFLIIFSSCSESSQTTKEAAPNNPMAALLLQRETELASIPSPYIVDDNKIKEIREMIKTSDTGRALEARFYLAKNLLFYGDAEGSIRELESLMADINELNVNLPPKQLSLFFNTLGLSYLRLGEELNCVDNANEATCIIPIAKDGIHTIKSASEAAVSNFEFALQVNPQDYETMWLLNLAHMTLGSYPEGVQKEYLIDPSKFKNDNNFPKFLNQGIKSGAGDNRLSGGCVIEDFNLDGYLDIMVSSWGNKDPLKVYINKGDGTFELMPEQENLRGIFGGLNMVSTDYNNDGYIDVLVLRGAWLSRKGCLPNSLLKGNGDGTFEDVTLVAGLTGMFPTQAAVWTDIDLDGNIDLFIGNENQSNENFASEFYYNNGDGTFTNIASKLGLDITIWVKGCSAGDVNNDGFNDLFVSNFKGDNYLFIHNGATEIDKIKFTNQAKERGVDQPFSSFSTWFLILIRMGMMISF
ncbi:MAG: VCBS repeat-containing protein [Saprospiraceae bacterium]